MRILLTLTAGVALLAVAGFMGSVKSQAAQNHVYAFGATTQIQAARKTGRRSATWRPTGSLRSSTETAMPGAWSPGSTTQRALRERPT